MSAEIPNITALVIVGTSTTLLLAGCIIFFIIYYRSRMLQNKIATQQLEADYQRELLQATVDSQEKERRRIAAELHDGVGAMLSAAKLNLNMLKKGTIPSDEMELAMVDTKEMIDSTIETVRKISKALLPSSLEIFGLGRALEELVEKLTTPQTKIYFHQRGENVKLNQQDELLIYRIVQELINNALKHAEASEVWVNVDWNNPINLTVSDNGKGFDLVKTKQDIRRGIGLYSIENRVSLIKAEVQFDSEINKGTRIRIVLGT
ncbi:sensor histidine kinase [Fulvivirga maritima]|uniref:sensor histidine kinase n=1 Tax=Fulvivirga maritima TaxID=2904247 RepID=UPI001F3703D7|nr:sensor histidine kinase [Fulvivirga maritima]UII28025.1 sensor histidine kinase [Fulvivirga maritima]